MSIGRKEWILVFIGMSLLVTVSGSRQSKKKIRKQRRSAKQNGERHLQEQTEKIIIPGVCVNSETPFIAESGNSCGIPDFVDPDIFGDNMNTIGRMRVVPTEQGLDLNIKLKGVPKPDLVMTAWIIWVPGGVTEPPIFEVANHAAPCAPFNASFSAGFGRDANELKYKKDSSTTAVLKTSLNFNPTYPGEGALTRETYCFQKDVAGIQDTFLAQPTTPGGVFIPTSSSYLRQYDAQTGFEMLSENGDPMVVRSPVKSLGVEIIIHTDKTTHGISQGIGGIDHYFMIFFPFNEPIGSKTV